MPHRSKGPLLVELDDADDALISEYADKGMTPILKIDASSPEKVQKALETLNKNPVAATIVRGFSCKKYSCFSPSKQNF